MGSEVQATLLYLCGLDIEVVLSNDVDLIQAFVYFYVIEISVHYQ